MSDGDRQPGWDRQAIMRTAVDLYGGLERMFTAHGWNAVERVRSHIAPTKVVETYGSVEAFVKAHEGGLELNPILDPMAATRCDPPEVWLTSLYGFTTESWGFLGFTQEWMRRSFIEKSRPGALVVVYAAHGAPEALRRRVLGVQQVSHRKGSKWDFLAPERVEEEQSDPDRRDRWVHAIKVVRGWRVPEEDRPLVDDFAPETYSWANAQVIGSQGMRLTRAEAQRVLELNLVECPVYGEAEVDALIPLPAEEALQPSRPGPVSKRVRILREAEGPKHLYILRMAGDEHALLGYDAGNGWIVKVGMSGSPSTRCAAHNKTLPKCAYSWKVERSTFTGRGAFPTSDHALAGEQTMKDLLAKEGRSLGGEFFLADQAAVERAWTAGIQSAENWTR